MSVVNLKRLSTRGKIFVFAIMVILAVISLQCFKVDLSSTRGDLDNDGEPETLLIKRRLFASRGDSLQILWEGGGNEARRWVGLKNDVNPWKVMVADVNGDGRQEVLVGAWRRTPKDRVLRNRLFIYNWTGSDLFPLWLGSRLSRFFTDFTVADLDGDCVCELVALETGPNGDHLLSVYRWEDFGFSGVGESLPAEMYGKLETKTINGEVCVVLSRGELVKHLIWDGGELRPYSEK